MRTRKDSSPSPPNEAQAAALHRLTEQALSRATGAPLIPGNRVRLLKDATENYPAWLRAMESAERWIHFETYIIHEDDVGRQFAALLAEKARQGVSVRLLYDWFGALGNTSRRFFRRLAESGVEVRCFNPPRLDSPFGWLSRDHRKLIAVDGRIGFVAGLCVGKPWAGDPARGREPWRDTGVELQGPALPALEQAFAEAWAAAGQPLPPEEIPLEEDVPPAGDVDLRIVAGVPNFGAVYRLDQLMAQLARSAIWISDAYFLGTSSYVQALRAAALSGVDVRLLVPGASDVPIMRALSRAGFRPLLEAGVRVFEWNGLMMHAKTAVVDGRLARVGSTNLNLASWLGNWELDLLIENERLARQMEETYLDDLSRATEIVLSARRRPRLVTKTGAPPRRRKRSARGSAGRAATGVLRLGNTVGAAITNRRELGPAEAVIMTLAAVVLMVFAAVAAYWPAGVVFPIVVVCLWVAISLLVRGYKLRSRGS
ncbi:MAG TPA: phospholipase D-like domain-containing protein [Terriglobia bacterium]|nr:phospholipase D-like domain-containing protein [Terriglobia bacterium]